MTMLDVKLNALTVSDDGRQVLLTALHGEDAVQLVFPAEQLESLLPAVAQAAAEAMRRRLDDGSVKRLLPVERCAVAPLGPGGGAIITFTVRDRVEIAVGLSLQQARRLQGDLGAHADVPESPTERMAPPN